jgi:adenosylhomocysteinase
MGASVIVCEVDPLRALQAALDGYRVMPIAEAARVGQVFVTVTGDMAVIRREHFELMQDGAIVCNSGHFDVEISLSDLQDMAGAPRRIRHATDEYTLQDGRRIFVLGEGRLVNLAAAEGHPAAVMDMSFANQALCSRWVAENPNLPVAVHPVPPEIDQQVALLKLTSMNMAIDQLTAEQAEYLSSWQMGT